MTADPQKNRLQSYKRIVIKIGSSLLVDKQTGLKCVWLQSLVDDVAKLISNGHEVLIVSSGAIALGRGLLGLKSGALKLEESQASAAAGQIALSRAYLDALGEHGIQAGQILLTLSDTEERRRYLNARATISTLLKLKAVPIINENDTVATTEIRYGDNDRLAARVATMMAGDLLILLSDIDGLYSAPPNDNPQAKLIEQINEITPEIEAMAGDAGTELSRGGMVTKIEAAKVAVGGGTTMVITSGTKLNPIHALDTGAPSSWFKASGNPATSRKKWIAGQLEVSGRLHLDAGAQKALESGKSLLPAGVKAVSGQFMRGDIVAMVNPDGFEIGRGIVAYDYRQADIICGRQSVEIARLLGFEGRSEMIHRDDLVLTLPGNKGAEEVSARLQ